MANKKDSLGDRMKEFYENRTRNLLPSQHGLIAEIMELKLEQVEKLQNDIEVLVKKYTDGTGVIKEWKVQSIAGSIVKNLIIPLVSNRTSVDFKKLRDAYFKEHVTHKTKDGIPMVYTHPHNLFEWFKAELKEYGC